MKRLIDSWPLQRLACLLLLLPAACAPPAAVNVPPPVIATPIASPAVALHAPEIRFALIGNATNANVWALFDSKGYSYNDYAIRSGYWPRLYDLTIPDGQFEPQAALGLPSVVQAEGSLFTATVRLRPDLLWTDGSAFTADDAVFTINTSLGFGLGFDWHAFYDPDWLDHASALNANTVKFYFRRAPNVAVWQYGALQGPIVQKKYWASRIEKATALLPSAESAARVESLQAKISDLQKRINDLETQSVTAIGDQAHQLEGQLRRQQGDLDQATNDLSKTQAGIVAAVEAARQALYALDSTDEPTLGTWIPAGDVNGTWTNTANPSHPFGQPHFDRATYSFYADQSSALAEMAKGLVDGLLDPQGLSANLVSHNWPGNSLTDNATPSAHFLVINPSRPELADRELRRALFCSIDRGALARLLIGTPLPSWVLPGNSVWSNPAAAVSCGNGYDPLNGFDPSKAVSILKSAGYTWSKEPTGKTPGVGLRMPHGQAFPPVALLAPSIETDPQVAQASEIIKQSAAYLGIPLTLQVEDPAVIRFALFENEQYDMAIVGWRLSGYPGYLCDWFGEGNSFGYSNAQIGADCQVLDSTSDLEMARNKIFDIQALLAQGAPIIPLYSGLTYEAYRGIRYPFAHVLGGLSSVYGAPSLALPAAP